MTETACSANGIDLKPPPSRGPQQQQQQQQQQRPRNASDASDFQLFETASIASSLDCSLQQQSQHSSPGMLSTSYETANRKRLRSGSVSGRIRSASEYLEEKGLLDRQTKGIMKDLIIIGDEELQAAIDRYESGDPSALEEMIQSGAMQNRLPKDLDILGDLDLDFLTMDESSLLPPIGGALPSSLMMMHNGTSNSNNSSSSSHDETAAHQLQQLHHSSCMISPDDDDDDNDGEDDEDNNNNEQEDLDEYDDDIGELDFHSDHDFDEPHDRIASDSPTPELSEHERRMRSNSLYSALINNHVGGTVMESGGASTTSYGRWMDPDHSHHNNSIHRNNRNKQSTEQSTHLPAVPAFSESSSTTIATRSKSANNNKNKKGNNKNTPPQQEDSSNNNIDDDDGPIKIRKKKGRRPKTASDIQESNLTKSLREHTAAEISNKKKQAKLQAKQDKLLEKQQQQQRKAPRKPRKSKLQQQSEALDDDAMDMTTANGATATASTVEETVHILGRPRSWSDPQLSVTLDEDGLRSVERPDGWVGAYSPDSRKERIKQFLTKRSLRVWTKSVKYNVRKDFANSRLRVKGRFVKKEDETLMRELMSLT